MATKNTVAKVGNFIDKLFGPTVFMILGGFFLLLSFLDDKNSQFNILLGFMLLIYSNVLELNEKEKTNAVRNSE